MATPASDTTTFSTTSPPPDVIRVDDQAMETGTMKVPSEGEWRTLKVRVSKWGKSVVGVLAGIFVVGLVIMVVVIIISTKTNPIPESVQASFTWGINYGGQSNKMVSGPFEFALLPDGNAHVWNNVTGEERKAFSTEQYTQGAGKTMTLDSKGLTVYDENGSPLASTPPPDGGVTTLVFLPNGDLVLQNDTTQKLVQWTGNTGKERAPVRESTARS